jgi:UDP-glucose 4-epimerase
MPDRSYASQTVLVTGGAGFIGSELVRQLCDAGAHVVVVDNLVNGKRENLAGLPPERVRLVEADIQDARVVPSLLAQADSVFHLACLGVRHSIHSPQRNSEVNATGTLQLLVWSRAAGVARFVYVSSSEVYGTARWAPMTEEHPTFPMTVYGAGKLAGEAYARAYHETYGFPTVIARPFNTYGPRCHHEGDSGEVIPKFLLRAMAGQPMIVFGDGSQTRDFTFVEDTARGIVLCGKAAAAVGKTFNLGRGEETTIRDLAAEVAGVAGNPKASIVHDQPRPGDVLRLYADTSQARDLLGYRPSVNLRDGLRRLRDWYLAQDRTPEKLLEEEIPRNWMARV